jgi:hypothetical protein
MSKKVVAKLSLTRWKKHGTALKIAEVRLRHKEFGHQWAIAEWMREGEDAFGKERARGIAAKATGMTKETLQQFAHTARRVLTRVKGLSFGHHRLVASLSKDEQKACLRYALEAKESVEGFAAYLRERKKDKHRRDDEKLHRGDRAADKVLNACGTFRNCSAFEMLLSNQPSPEKASQLLNDLKAAVSDLNSKIERLSRLWGYQRENALGATAQ